MHLQVVLFFIIFSALEKLAFGLSKISARALKIVHQVHSVRFCMVYHCDCLRVPAGINEDVHIAILYFSESHQLRDSRDSRPCFDDLRHERHHFCFHILSLASGWDFRLLLFFS